MCRYNYDYRHKHLNTFCLKVTPDPPCNTDARYTFTMCKVSLDNMLFVSAIGEMLQVLPLASKLHVLTETNDCRTVKCIQMK